MSKVEWVVKLSDGNTRRGSCSDGSWLKVLDDTSAKIQSVCLTNGSDEANIDKNRGGYFICCKSSLSLGSQQTDLIAIGYLDNNVVRIKWYSLSLELQTNEVRSIQKCGRALVLNPDIKE